MGALSAAEKDILHRSFFLKREIEDFDNARAIDGTPQRLNVQAENFQMMIRNRIRRVKQWKAAGRSRDWVIAQISSYYSEKHRSKRSAYDLLQIENSPGARQRPETDNSIARRLLKLARVQSSFGANYTQSLPDYSQQQPRNIPRRPEY
jgi:hypothetical protein